MFELIKKELLEKYGAREAELVKLRGGAGDKILFFAFFENRREPESCLKTPAFVGGNDLIESEFNKLKELKSSLPEELKNTIPEPRCLLSIGGRLASVEEAVNGRQACFDLSKKDLKKVFDWVCAFHKVSVLERKEINKNFLIEFLRAYGDKAGEAIGFVEEKWNFGDIKIPLIKQHGDFHFANVFFARESLKVIDWSKYGDVILPAYDLVFFLRRQKRGAAPDNELLAEYFNRFSMPSEIIPFWIEFTSIIEELEKWAKK